MSFFKKILGVMASMGFIVILFVICAVTIILNENKINRYKENNEIIDIYKNEEIENIKIIDFDEKLKIDVEFKNTHYDKYYLAYGYYYLDKYNKNIEMSVKEKLNYTIINIYSDNSSYIIKTT